MSKQREIGKQTGYDHANGFLRSKLIHTNELTEYIEGYSEGYKQAIREYEQKECCDETD